MIKRRARRGPVASAEAVSAAERHRHGAESVRAMTRRAAAALLVALAVLSAVGAEGAERAEGAAGGPGRAPELAQLLPALLGASLEELLRAASNSCT